MPPTLATGSPRVCLGQALKDRMPGWMQNLSLGGTGRWSGASKALSSALPGWKGALGAQSLPTLNSGGRGAA